MKLKALSYTVLAALLSSTVWADGGPNLDDQSKMRQVLSRYDINKDGVATRDETIAARTAEFNKADTNVDTYLSWDEFKALADSKRTERLNAIFKVMDTVADGSISSAEFIAASTDQTPTQAAELFALLDANVDNMLSLTELQVLIDGDEPLGLLMRQFTALDTDTDGKLTVTEYTTKPVKTPVPPKVRPTPSSDKPFTAIAVTNTEAIAAANFAASKLGTATVKLIMSAELQTATISTYRLAITLSDGKSYLVIVTKAADGTMQLKESKTLTPITGGYTTRLVTDADVIAVANFAATKLGTATVTTIQRAESQVVAGTNYRMVITLSDGKSYSIVVFVALDGTMQLKESSVVK